jgi:hypothetical protein
MQQAPAVSGWECLVRLKVGRGGVGNEAHDMEHFLGSEYTTDGVTTEGVVEEVAPHSF